MHSNIKKIRKRDGRIVPFEKEKIANAIFKAAQAVGGHDRKLAEELAGKVVSILEKIKKKFPGQIPTVEDVQDIVEKVLIEEGHARTAKAYILYREKHKELRDAKKLLLDSQAIVRDYIAKEDWEVYSNANVVYSIGGLLWHGIGTVMTYYGLNALYPKEISQVHMDGDLHLHNLSMSLAGYCAGWSLRQLLHEGFNGIPAKVECAPPKHLRTAVGQMINFIGTLQNEWAGAQAFNSFDTYLAPFVKVNKLSYKEVKQAIQEFVFNMNVASRWGSQCVSEDTEALTDRGWKKYYEINESDKIATFNIKTGKIEYLKPERVMAYDYDGYLVCLKNRTQEQLVTPDHRIVRKKFNSEKFEFTEAKDLFKFKTPILLPTAAETESKKEISNNMLKLYAWLVSEGSFSDGNRQRIYIFQSKKNIDNCNEIRECLRSFGFKWDETEKKGGFSKIPTIRFRLNQDSSRKVRQIINSKKIPALIKTLSKRQIKLFLDTYVKGDGFVESNGRTRIYTKDVNTKNQLQELCPLCGYGSTNSLRKHNNVWQINIIRNGITSITKLSKVRYKGKVWCPTTQNGTFVARRKGKIFITGNTPFTNITLDLVCPQDLKDQKVTVGGKLLRETYSDFADEAEMINRAFIEVMIEGDVKGRVFTFPIPTYNITRDFKWDDKLTDALFEMTSKYGLPYFQNFIKSDLKPSDVRAMCCRLRLNLKELMKNTGGRFGSGESTGSIGVVTINMPRIGYLAKDENEFFERLERLMYLAKQSLEIKRKIVEKNMEKNLLPYTKRYLGNLKRHFSTIGLIGMNEACLNFLSKGIASKEGQTFTIKVLKFMRKKLLEYQKETGNIYNLEATPGEGCSYRLARIDKQKYPEIKTAGIKEPYYTNSTQLPVDYTDDIFTALKHQEPLQKLYTGGTVFHAFLGESLTSGKECKLFVKKIAENFTLPYFTITPTFSICPEHGYFKGAQEKCPKCGKATEVYSRVVGYLRPVANWNWGKQEEFKQRKTFNVQRLYEEVKAREKVRGKK